IVVTDRDTGRPRGFGFVIFEDERDAKEAIDALDNTEVDGRTIRVSESRPRGDGGGRSSYGGRGGGRGYSGGRGRGYSGGGGRYGGGGGYGGRSGVVADLVVVADMTAISRKLCTLFTNVRSIDGRNLLCGRFIIFCSKGDEEVKKYAFRHVEVPATVDCLQETVLQGILTVIPLQLLSFHVPAFVVMTLIVLEIWQNL
ncbi:glycine-rich RNA-binding GRP1A-like, partial [Paramuricea clavata]